MASITQTVSTYEGGISQQVSARVLPGQVKNVVNAIPDVVNGLYKRPGSERAGVDKLPNVQSGGSWFHYYRDEAEGSYIGQVKSGDGSVRMWKASGHNAGAEQDVTYGTGGATDIKDYLTASAAGSEDIQTLTLNDTTFLVNRSKEVKTSGTTDDNEHDYFAFVELLRTENGRQYALNVFDSETTTTIPRATRIRIKSDTLDEGDGTGACPGIGTQVFSKNIGTGSGVGANNGKNLIFKLTILGQQGRGNTNDATPEGDDYRCSYNRQVTLLHGGEGWDTGDEATVTLGTANTEYDYTIEVLDHESAPVKADIKAVRPIPTPFDADTAVTVDTILGGIVDELDGTNVHCTIIGNGLYLRSSNAFQVEVVDQDLMRVMHKEVNDVTKLPTQCKDGYIVKVGNARMSDEDDYYVKFQGTNGKDGDGSWVECAAPGIVKGFDKSTMPHVIQRTGLANEGTDTEKATFTVKQFEWADREVGDDVTNQAPSFVGTKNTADPPVYSQDVKINKVLFFRNRIAFLTGSHVILSQPNTAAKPNFWSATALTVSAIDPIDIECSSNFPSDLFDGIEVTTGLLCFSTNQQFLLSSDDTVLNPDTAKLRSVSAFNYNQVIPPVSLGPTVAWLDNSGKYSRFMESANILREGEPTVVDTSKLVPSLLSKDIDLFTNSRENNLVFFGKTGSNDVIGFRYWNTSEGRRQSAWFKWTFRNPAIYHFCIDDTYYYLDDDHFLQRVNLIQATDDPSISQDDVNYLLHLDNHTTIQGGTYNATTKKTTFTHNSRGCVFDWQSDVDDGNDKKLVLVDSNTNTRRLGRYAECTVTSAGSTFTVPGNWDYDREYVITATSDIDVNNETINNLTDHGLSTGDPVRWYQGTSAATGLSDNTGYFVIRVNENKIKLATTADNANTGTAINITNQGSGLHRLQKSITGLHIGYLYDYQVDFPRIYVTRQQGQETISEINASLVLHRLKLNFGKIGLYETTLSRVGKADYTKIYESTVLDEYDVSDAPYLEEKIQTVPVYEKNTNVDITLKSTHPAPATLHSMSWEGDYSPKNYRRA